MVSKVVSKEEEQMSLDGRLSRLHLKWADESQVAP